jgi:hypothetical protein
MEHLQTPNRHSSGRFVKGRSGNPAGRRRGSTGHAAELRRAEEAGLALALSQYPNQGNCLP